MKIEKINESFLRVFGSRDCIAGIKDFFTFKVPGYQFSPKFKQKLWDGNISLYNMQTNKLPIGLHQLLLQYAERVGEEVSYLPIDDRHTPIENDLIDFQEFSDFVESLNISNGKGEPIKAKSYQISAAWDAVQHRRLVLQMPTGSGKSLTIYIIIRWLMSQEKRTILLVPSISLVKQMLSDFVEYSILNGFDIDTATRLLYTGQEKDFTAPILISTWQSVSKLAKTSYGHKAINSYDAIIVDEAHTAKGKELQSILEMATEVPYKIGTTGTIDNQKINELMIVGAIGPIKKIITTKELMDDGHLSDMIIKPLILQYSEEESRRVKSMDYQGEMDFICSHARRNQIIANLALSTTGTTMILCNFVDKHLIPLYQIIQEKAKKTGRKVYQFHGDVDPDERERIRKIASEEDCIIVASYSTAQQGINIPKIDTVILASPAKSSIRVLQSIGRGLRKALNKSKLVLIDVVDDLRVKKHENTTFQHFIERLKIYRVEQFDVQMKELKI